MPPRDLCCWYSTVLVRINPLGRGYLWVYRAVPPRSPAERDSTTAATACATIPAHRLRRPICWRSRAVELSKRPGNPSVSERPPRYAPPSRVLQRRQHARGPLCRLGLVGQVRSVQATHQRSTVSDRTILALLLPADHPLLPAHYSLDTAGVKVRCCRPLEASAAIIVQRGGPPYRCCDDRFAQRRAGALSAIQNSNYCSARHPSCTTAAVTRPLPCAQPRAGRVGRLALGPDGGRESPSAARSRPVRRSAFGSPQSLTRAVGDAGGRARDNGESPCRLGYGMNRTPRT